MTLYQLPISDDPSISTYTVMHRSLIAFTKLLLVMTLYQLSISDVTHLSISDDPLPTICCPAFFSSRVEI